MNTEKGRESDVQSSHIIIFKIFSFQQRVTREACKELRTSDHSQEKKKLSEILPEEEQVLNLLEKDFKSTLKYAQKYKSNHGQKKS